jgi:dipeptidyl aminopeptidase/acylaminoacyl peptidase
MAYRLARRTLGGFMLLCAGCSGHDILLATGGVGAGGADVGGASAGGASADGAAGAPMGLAPTGWIAFDADYSSLGRHLQIAAADGSCTQSLTSGSNQEKQAAWSADGKQLAFASDGTGKFQIYTMDLKSGKQTQISNEADGATYPSWSPDGKSIAFVTGDPEQNAVNGSSAAMLFDIASGKTRTLAPAKQPPYTWSAFDTDSLLLIGNFVSLIGIHIDTLAQYDIVPITGRIPNPTSPSISPDGTHLVFSDYCGGESQLYVARVDGKTGDTCANALPLAQVSEGLVAASWGPSGYVAAETKHQDLVLVPADGSLGIRVLANSPAPERNPAYAPAAADIRCAP